MGRVLFGASAETGKYTFSRSCLGACYISYNHTRLKTENADAIFVNFEWLPNTVVNSLYPLTAVQLCLADLLLLHSSQTFANFLATSTILGRTFPISPCILANLMCNWTRTLTSPVSTACVSSSTRRNWVVCWTVHAEKSMRVEVNYKDTVVSATATLVGAWMLLMNKQSAKYSRLFS